MGRQSSNFSYTNSLSVLPTIRSKPNKCTRLDDSMNIKGKKPALIDDKRFQKRVEHKNSHLLTCISKENEGRRNYRWNSLSLFSFSGFFFVHLFHAQNINIPSSIKSTIAEASENRLGCVCIIICEIIIRSVLYGAAILHYLTARRVVQNCTENDLLRSEIMCNILVCTQLKPNFDCICNVKKEKVIMFKACVIFK